jgi:endonuclease-3
MIGDKAQVRRNVTLCRVERQANVCQIENMKLSERVDLIDCKLNELYPSPPIPLEHKDPFTLLVAVLLSAQCTDARVNKVTPELFSLADNPFDMSKQSVEAINQIVRPCGLAPRKAQAIKGLSEILLSKHEGEVPSTLDELEELPGVGHKTASVVMTQAFGHPTFPVDTHIHRLAQRWKLTNGKSVTQTEKDLKRHFPKERWNKLHLQIIYYGREHCQAHTCHGLGCMICKACFPERKRQVKTRKA